MVILFLLAIGTIMKGDFQMFWQVTGNNPMVLDVTDVIDTYVTRSLLNLQEFGMTSAAGLYQSVFSFILVPVSYTHLPGECERHPAIFHRCPVWEPRYQCRLPDLWFPQRL